MGTPIVSFSPSDIADQQASTPAPKAAPAPTPISSHVTFSASDIDQNAQPSTASYAPAPAASPTMWNSAVTAAKSDPNIQAIGGAIDSATEHTQGLGPIKTLFNMLPVSGALKDLADIPAEYRAYEAARAKGASITDAANVAAETFRQKNDAIAQLKNTVKAFTDNPGRATGKAVADLLPMIIGGVGLDATPEVAGDLEGSTAAATHTLDSASGSIEPVSEAASVTPKAQAVAQGVSKAAKAGVSEGTAETVASTGADIQPHLHQGLRNFINKTLDDAGLDAVPDSTPITDAPQELADAFQARSQAVFNKVEELTGINPTTLKEQMAARADQITEAAAGGDLEKAGQLDAMQKADETRALNAFNRAKAQGVDIDQARSDWNSSIRGDELSAAVRGSKSNTSTMANPILDPGKLAPRLQKLAESQPGGKASKLFQLGGKDHAALVEHAENARDATAAIKDFVPTSATGQKLFSQILSNNTVEKSSLLRGGKSVGATDWNGVVKDIGNLTPRLQSSLGDDLARMRQVAGRQALKQNAAKALKVGSGLGLAEEVTRRGMNALSGQ